MINAGPCHFTFNADQNGFGDNRLGEAARGWQLNHVAGQGLFKARLLKTQRLGSTTSQGTGMIDKKAFRIGQTIGPAGGADKITRDVLAEEPNLLLRREIYITAALLGASVFAVLKLLGAPFWPAGLAGFVAAFGLRACAIKFGWSLPGFAGEEEARDA